MARVRIVTRFFRFVCVAGRVALEGLLERYRENGDLGALSEFITRTAPKLLQCARALCRDGGSAEDLAQATYLTFLQKLDDLDLSRPIYPWLVGVLTYHARNERRRAQPPAELPAGLVTRLPGPPQILEERDLWRQLRTVMNRLPGAVRSVLCCVLEEEMSPRQVSARLGISRGATRSRLHRGMQALRVKMRDWGEGVLPGVFGCARFREQLLRRIAGESQAARGAAALATGASGPLVLQPLLLSLLLLATVASWWWWMAPSPRPAPQASQKTLAALPNDELGDAPASIESDIRQRQPSREQIWLQPEGVLVSGRVLEAEGDAAAIGAQLYLMLETRFGPQLLCDDPLGSTDTQGEFCLNRRLSAHPSGAPYLLVALSRAGAWGIQQLPTVRGREQLRVRIELARQAGLIVEVRDRMQRALVGMEVEFVPCFSPWPVTGGKVMRSVENLHEHPLLASLAGTTDASGVLRKSLPLSAYLAMSLGPSATDQAQWSNRTETFDFEVRVTGAGLVPTTRRVSARGAEEQTVRITMAELGEKTLSGGVFDPSGHPVAGAQVAALSPRAGEAPTLLSESDENGRWHWPVDREFPRPLRLQCSKAGHASVEVTLQDDQGLFHQQLADFVLEPSVLWHGVVTDDRGEPVAGAEVEWVPGPSSLDFRQFYAPDAASTKLDDQAVVFWRVQEKSAEQRNLTVTSAKGEFQLAIGSEAGGRLLAIPPAPHADWRGVSTTLLRGRHQVQRLTLFRRPGRPARLDAEIRCRQGGDWLTPTEAFLSPSHSLFARLPGSLRPFEIPIELEHGWVSAEGLFPGEWLLYVHVADQGMHVTTFTVEESGEELLLAVDIDAPARLTGQLSVVDGCVDLQGLKLRLHRRIAGLHPMWANASRLFTTAEVDEGGAFRIDNLTTGPWYVECLDPPLLFEDVCLELQPGDNAVHLRALVAGRLEFTRSEGSCGGAVALWMRQSEQEWHLCGSGIGGALNVTLPPGHYDWKVTFPQDLENLHTSLAPPCLGSVPLAGGETMKILY